VFCSTFGRRLSSVVGVARRMKFSPAFWAGMHSSASSSGGRSTTISPSIAGLGRLGQETVDAAGIDRVVIAHQHDGGGVVPCAEGAHHGQHPVHRHAAFQRALAGGLDGRAVGHRVGEGHAQFDDVDARGGQALHHGQAGRRRPGRRP
jgi:hypothetical protein